IPAVRSNAHQIAVRVKTIVEGLPCRTRIEAFRISAACRFIHASRNFRVGRQRMTVMLRSRFTVFEALSPILAPHDTTEFYSCENTFRVMNIRLDETHMMSLRPGRETPC